MPDPAMLLRRFALMLIALTASVVRAEPVTWTVEGGTAPMTIMGTIHLLDNRSEWYDGQVAVAFEKSQILVLEIDPNAVDRNAINQLVSSRGYYPEGQTLRDRLGRDRYLELIQASAAVGLPPDALTRMRPWFAALNLVNAAGQSIGFQADYGADEQLAKLARFRRTPIVALESAEQQLGLIANLSEDAQIQLITRDLSRSGSLTAYFPQVRDAWLTGDLDELDRLVGRDMRQINEVAQALLYNRNRNWIAKLERLLGGDDAVLVAVGAAHLLGPESVIDLLRKRGYRVTRNRPD